MIRGTVTAALAISVRLAVLDRFGQETDLDAVLDTGFNGQLSFPPALISVLGLDFERSGVAVLADGSVTTADYYAATLMWEGQPRSALVISLDSEPSLGTLLLENYDLRARMKPGGPVEIEEIL